MHNGGVCIAYSDSSSLFIYLLTYLFSFHTHNYIVRVLNKFRFFDIARVQKFNLYRRNKIALCGNAISMGVDRPTIFAAVDILY